MNLDNKIVVKSTGHRNHHCDQCEKSFKCATMLANHIACLHSDLRPFKCKICPSTFKLKTSLDKHNKGHLMSFRFECLQCDKCYKSKHSLNQHIFIKHTMDPSYRKILPSV